MKIGILTFHDGINHGAYLQTFCLYKYLEEKGYDIEIINYINFRRKIEDYKSIFLSKNPVRLKKNIKKYFRFRGAHKLINMSKIVFSAEKINSFNYDAIIVGSDVVWNFGNNTYGFNPLYFGHSLKTKKLISYAPSFGSTSESIKIPSLLKRCLKRFDKISVRDKNSLQIVNRVIKKIPPIVLDPVFLIDISKYEKKCNESNFILVYSYHLTKKQQIKLIEFAKDKSMKLISLGYDNPWCDENIIDIGPFEMLGYFREAEYVVTSTFHGSMLSLIYNKRFCICSNDHIYNKTSSLLGELNLLNLLILDDSLTKTLNYIIDYRFVNTKLKKMSDYSKNYLLSSLK